MLSGISSVVSQSILGVAKYKACVNCLGFIPLSSNMLLLICMMRCESEIY
jgi:hypothetical protein